MKKLLHIIATPRQGQSRTLKISRAFLESFSKKYPDCEIDELNVSTEDLPALTQEVAQGKYALLSGKEITEDLKDAWQDVERQIMRFLSADAYLISTPMWNLNIPYTLKQYIDVIVQPKYLFQYTKSGVEGLVKNKKMAVVTSRGGDYSQGTASAAYDLQEPYLRARFGFVGITDIKFIIAQPVDMGPDIEEKKVQQAITQAREVAGAF